MITLQRTDSGNVDFVRLVAALDAELGQRDGDDHSFYDQFNKIDKIKYAVVAYDDGKPAGCGAIKEFSSDTMEVKRMYTHPEHRGRRIASKILRELEMWAVELSYQKCVLETGKRQPEAIELYRKNGYKIISNYGQYTEVENSICFEKEMTFQK